MEVPQLFDGISIVDRNFCILEIWTFHQIDELL